MQQSLSVLMFLLFSVFLVRPVEAQKTQAHTIRIDAGSQGRIFDGIGALSAGASSRLLMDYPDLQRNQILDLLFKPRFGASLQTFKVEIGGDINSTDGAEPSHARTREEFLNPRQEYFERGYEWWLMKEAKKRNPDISLDALEWGAPGWIGNGVFYSQDNIDYIISFIKGARKYHDLTIDYAGSWNERKHDVDYIKQLRKSLDNNGLQKVKIVASDQCCGNEWSIAADIKQDKELLQSISAFGDHYPERSAYPSQYQSHPLLKETGKPVENSEGGPWIGTWDGLRYLVKMYNRDYIIGKMTRQITWSLVSSYYDNLSLPGSGLMKANSPWSGHFDIEPGIWAAAHTTQFTAPGWRYLDEACGFMADSTISYVTLMSPAPSNDYSIIIETMDAVKSQEVIFNVSGSLSKNRLSVWESTYQQEAFVRQKDIVPHKGKFRLRLEPRSVYSITTTTGQQKGTYPTPENKPFPFPYYTGFENDVVGQLPKYFSDQAGAFEIRQRSDNNGKCLQQVIRQAGIEWEPNGSFISTIIGDTTWANYEVTADVNIIENNGSAKILGRLMDVHRGSMAPDGYWFEIYSGGKWALYSGITQLKSGRHEFAPFRWHTLKLRFAGNNISASIDGTEVVNIKDDTYSHGMAGLGTGYDLVQFDNFSVTE